MAIPVLKVPDDVRPRRGIDLEDLVGWTIRNQMAHRDQVSLHGVETGTNWGLDSCLRVARISTVGTRIDGGGPIRGVPPRMHPDAEAVIGAIQRAFGGGGRPIVVDHAFTGRPEWNLGPQRLWPVENTATQGGGRRHRVGGEWETVPLLSYVARRMMARGIRIIDDHGRRRFQQSEPGFRYRTLDDGTRQVFVRCTPLELAPSDAEVRDARAEYAAWHAGMMRVLGELLGVPLRDHRLTGFAAPATPWNISKEY
ncbi:hypothetical protein [Azospirillum argentinense]